MIDDFIQESTAKATLQTIEAIEMELEKMHGEDKNENVSRLDLEENSQTFGSFDNSEPIDAGAIEHSSDSDFDPSNHNNSEALLEAARTAEKHLGMFLCFFLQKNFILSLLFLYIRR